jgi:hypothetical protein
LQPVAARTRAGLGPGQGACKIHPPETDGQFALPFTVPPEVRPEDGCYNGFNIKTAQPYNGNFLEFTVLDVSVK